MRLTKAQGSTRPNAPVGSLKAEKGNGTPRSVETIGPDSRGSTSNLAAAAAYRERPVVEDEASGTKRAPRERTTPVPEEKRTRGVVVCGIRFGEAENRMLEDHGAAERGGVRDGEELGRRLSGISRRLAFRPNLFTAIRPMGTPSRDRN